MPTNGDIFQNFCDGGGGFVIQGPSGTPAATVRRNYVRGAGGIDVIAGNVSVSQNILDGGSITTSAGTTLSKNVCGDATDCPNPDSNFTLNVDFTP